LLRVPVGLEPVTVVEKPTRLANGIVRYYTANWLGDSITAFTLTPTGTSPPLGWKVERTVQTADEPIGIAILPEIEGDPSTLPGSAFHEGLIVTHASQGVYSALDSTTLIPFNVGWQALELFDTSGALGIKEPRAVELAPPESGANPHLAVLTYSVLANQPAIDALIQLLEDQANQANSGVDVHQQVAGETRGF
jgi:hypothetical protein